MSDKKIEIDVVINTADAAKGLKETKSALKQLQDAALAIGSGAEGFDKLNAKASELREKLEDVADSANSLRGTGVEKLTNSFGLLKQSLGSADFGKASIALKGIGAAMKAIPIFLIVEGIRYLIEKFDDLKNSGGILGKVFTAIGDVIGWVIQKFKDLTDWLGLTNNAIEDNAEKTIKAAKKVEERQKDRYDSEIKLAKAAGKDTYDLEIQKQQAVIISAGIQLKAITAVAKANGTMTDKQKEDIAALVKVINDANTEIQADQIAHTKKLGEENTKRGEKAKETYDKNYKDFLDNEAKKAKLAEDITKTYEELEKKKQAVDIQNNEKDITEYEKKNNALKRSHDQEIKNLDKMLTDKKIDESDYIEFKASADLKYKLDKDKLDNDAYKEWSDLLNKQNDDYKAAGKQQTDTDKKTTEERKKNLDNAFKEISDALNGTHTTFGAIASDISNTIDSFIKLSKEKFKSAADEVNAYAQVIGSSISSLLTSIGDLNKEKADERVKVNDDALKQQVGDLEAARDREVNKEGLTADQKKAINEKYAKQEYELKLKEYTANTAIKKKAFEQDKKLRIAQAVIATITGAIAAVTGMISAIPGPVGIVLGVVAGLAVTAAGVLQIAKINAQKFDAGSPPTPPSVSGGGGADSANAQFNPTTFGQNSGAAGLNAGSPGGTRPSVQPQRVYVTQTDIAAQDKKVNVLQERASYP